MILIVSHVEDDHAMGVLAAIENAGYPAVLVDTARFPAAAALSQHFFGDRTRFVLSTDGRNIELGECHVGWWRRPRPFELPSDLSPGAVSFAYGECHEAITGLWAALNLRWINPPELDELAHHKPYQLSAAVEVGLSIPRTVITNDAAVAREFIAEIGVESTVYKTFLATEQHWRETRILRFSELEKLDLLGFAPTIFQEYIPAVAYLRVTVVGERLFTAAISIPSGGYAVDYRMCMEEASFRPTQLSPETAERIGRLMRRLGLVYGALDLRRTPDGRDIFLEVNPAGEWRFVEERTHQPITEAMAELLIDLDQAT